MANQNTQTSSGLSNLIQSYYERRLLDRLTKKLHFGEFGMKQVLKKNSGKTVTWNRYANLSENTTALTEGESPDGLNLSTTQYVATVAGYGQFVSVSDYLEMSAISSVMDESVDLLGYAGGLSMDALIRNEVDANGTQQYTDPGNNSTRANVESGADVMDSASIRKATKTLRTNDVDTWDDGLLRGIIHPISEFDLLAESSAGTFLQVVQYTSADEVKKGAIGNIYGVKLFRSTHVRSDATSTHVYQNCFFGKNAYGMVDFEGAGMELIVKQKGAGEDPLNQRATVGYKFYFAVKTLDANRIVVVNAYGA